MMRKYRHVVFTTTLITAKIMARPIRIQSESQVYFVRNICIQQEFLMLPKDEVLRIVRGCLARAAYKHNVNIYAFNFLLNRFGMLLSAPELNLPEFMASLQGRIAVELNKLYGRRGQFFEAPYLKADVVDEEGQVERFNFITNSPVELGLIKKLEDWGGLSSWDYFQTGDSITGSRLNRTEFSKHKRKSKNKRKKYEIPDDAGFEHFEFKLAKLPAFEKLSDAEYRRIMSEHVEAHGKKLREKRAKSLKKPLGMAKIFELTWRNGPAKYAHIDRSLAYGSDGNRASHLLALKPVQRAYAEAMEVYVENKERAVFPPYTNRPGLMICEKPDREIGFDPFKTPPVDSATDSESESA